METGILITLERINLFDHWKIDDKLKELGWKKHEIPFFKKGLIDSIQGNWNDNIINYSYDYDSWYCDMLPEPTYPPDPEFKYPDPKKKHGPVTYKEKAYTTGYEAGEVFIKQWVKELSTILDFISGE